MTDQEINEAVARKLGHTLGCCHSDTLEMKTGYGDLDAYVAIPDYCHSIEAAWEIVEEANEYEFILIFHGWADGSKFFEATINEQKAEADTAPMAICLAFLKLKD